MSPDASAAVCPGSLELHGPMAMCSTWQALHFGCFMLLFPSNLLKVLSPMATCRMLCHPREAKVRLSSLKLLALQLDSVPYQSRGCNLSISWLMLLASEMCKFWVHAVALAADFVSGVRTDMCTGHYG